ncbi:hypothetical protein OH799_33970 [Nocardia sp. NBC_00881]|uniref:hypothetical protein n=1 Tax=Nocardia sp. NBC_00881 TaxID=2975995 RepID=UPI003868A46C|nr:hypothetical protein OH799_33970 [Nocardia sp. NBC_00881]
MAMKVTDHVFLTRAARESLPPVLQGVTLDRHDGIPIVAGHSGTRVDESGWIRIDAVPYNGDPGNYQDHVQLRLPPTSVAAILSVPQR